jgi:hypothetical protein
MLTALARLFMRAGPIHYAWRPATTRTGVRESDAAADPPVKTNGGIVLDERKANANWRK